MTPFNHCRFDPPIATSPCSVGTCGARVTVFVIAALLATGFHAPRTSAEDLEIGLYRNGQLVERLGTIPAPEAPKAARAGLQSAGARKRVALQGLATEPTAPLVSAPELSAETQRRNAAFASAAQPAIAMRDLLREMKGKPGQGTPVDRQQINTLLQQFAAAQEDVRAVLVETGNRIVRLGLDPVIVERQMQTMEHFEGESAQLQELIAEVTAGAPNAVDKALRYLEEQKFQEIPSLEKATPTHRIYVAEAPRLTREEADALQAQSDGSGAASARRSIRPLDARTTQVSARAELLANSPPIPADLAETIDVQITQAIQEKAAALGNRLWPFTNSSATT